MATGENILSEIPKVSGSDIKYDETPIGRGGYGYVYRGVHKDLGTVAIKTMIADGLLPARHLRVFKAEGRKLWELRHPSIVRLLGLIMEEGNYSLVLEYMHFGSLTAFRSDFVDIDWSLIVSIVRDVIHGMDYLHATDPPILHLDLKSDNILINRRIRAKITDFGLSQWKTMTRTMTRGGDEKGRKGTVTHVPPEVWNNINTPPNKAYDVYSFAIVLWETMVGDRPFARVSDDIIPKAVLSGQRPDSTLVPATCPKELVNMMTASWVQQPEKRLQFEAMVPDIDKLFEKMAPSVADGLSKLETEIQNLYTSEDLGGDTAATADSESLFDAATKLTKPLTSLSTASPMSVEIEDIGEEMDIPETTSPKVSDSQKLPIVGLQDEDEPMPGPLGVSTKSSSSSAAAAASKSASTASASKPASTASTSGSASTASTSASGTGTGRAATSKPTQGSTSSAGTSQTQPKITVTQTSNSQVGTSNQGEGRPEVQEFILNDEQKKALRRVMRDPVAMLLLHKDAELCKRVFGIDLELQKKVKNTGELLKILDQDPILRVELQRKGSEHLGWVYNPNRMKDEIRRKRPARSPKPEVVERMKKLREERLKREKDLPKSNFGDPREKRGFAAGLKGLFKKDKPKMKGPMSKYMHPMEYDPYGPMGDFMSMRANMAMGMSIPPDMSYKLKRILRDPQMVRYMLGEQRPGKMVAIDREVMELIQDPDKMLYLITKDPSLMQTLAMTDRDAFMKMVARARGGPSRIRDMMRGSRRMPGMYRGLERDMMDMDLDDEMMMMHDADRYQRHRMEREMMDMLKKPGLPSDYPKPSSSCSSSSSSSTANKPSSTVSKPPSTSSDSTTPKVNVSKTRTSDNTTSSNAITTNSSTTSSSETGTSGSTTSSSATSTGGSTTSNSATSTTNSTTGNAINSTTTSGAKSLSGTSSSEKGETSAKTDVATRIGESSRKIVEPEMREIQGLPDDHLVQRQENIKTPVQRHTDTEPLQTAVDMIMSHLKQSGEAPQPPPSSQMESNNSSSSQGAQAASSSSSTEKAGKTGKSKKSEKKVPISNSSSSGQGQSSTAGQGHSSTSGQGQSSTAGHSSTSGQGQSSTASQGQSASLGQGQFSAATGLQGSLSFTMTDPSKPSEEVRIKLNPDGSMSGNYDLFNMPPGIQFGRNNTMVLNNENITTVIDTPSRREGTSRKDGTHRKRAQDYQHKWMKFSKKHRIAHRAREDEIRFEHVNMIAENIGSKWMELAEELDMDPLKLRELRIEYQANGEDDYDACVQVLKDLLTRKSYYSIPDLIQDLKKIQCQKIAIKLISLIE